jgi:hypothetical protein
MDVLTQASVVTLGIFVVGLVWNAGVTYQRLNVVERDQNRLYDELRAIRSSLDQLVGAKTARED